MIENMEFGYTPSNLKALRKKYNLTQQMTAEIVGVKNWQNITRWETSADKKNHANMPYEKWLILLNYVNNFENNQMVKK